MSEPTETNNTKNKDGILQQNDTDASGQTSTPKEIGGPQGLEPTRYGDWERRGRCIDF